MERQCCLTRRIPSPTWEMAYSKKRESWRDENIDSSWHAAKCFHKLFICPVCQPESVCWWGAQSNLGGNLSSFHPDGASIRAAGNARPQIDPLYWWGSRYSSPCTLDYSPKSVWQNKSDNPLWQQHTGNNWPLQFYELLSANNLLYPDECVFHPGRNFTTWSFQKSKQQQEWWQESRHVDANTHGENLVEGNNFGQPCGVTPLRVQTKGNEHSNDYLILKQCENLEQVILVH